MTQTTKTDAKWVAIAATHEIVRIYKAATKDGAEIDRTLALDLEALREAYDRIQKKAVRSADRALELCHKAVTTVSIKRELASLRQELKRTQEGK